MGVVPSRVLLAAGRVGCWVGAAGQTVLVKMSLYNLVNGETSGLLWYLQDTPGHKWEFYFTKFIPSWRKVDSTRQTRQTFWELEPFAAGIIKVCTTKL